MRTLLFGLCWLALLGCPRGALGFELTASLTLEMRAFLEGRGASGQAAESVSVAFEPEFYHAWDDDRQSLRGTLFGRLDGSDSQRSHADVRELYWQWVGRSWEVSVGWKKIFWGVTESAHLVDVINQTDWVEDLDGEQKLGQGMVQLSLIRSWGTVDFFVLPGFRERRFAGPRGRLRTRPEVAPELTEYTSDEGDDHVDWSVRWSHSLGSLDVGLHYFDGTGREPRLRPARDERDRVVLQPVYEQIEQLGLDLQSTQGPWLFKTEAVDVRGGQEPYRHWIAGFEYTVFDLWGQGFDLGLLAEFSNDGRADRPNTTFIGSRWAFNDTQSTDLLAGAIFSEDEGVLWTLEGSRRLGDSWRLNVRARGFTDVPLSSPLGGLRQDDYLEVELAKFF